MRPKDVDPHVPQEAKTESELTKDLENTEDDIERLRKMIKIWNDAVRNGTSTNIPEEQKFEYETAGNRLEKALYLRAEIVRQIQTLMSTKL